MKYKVLYIMAAIMAATVSMAFAIDWNPVHLITNGAGIYGIVVLVVGYAFKLKLDALKLKAAVSDIKLTLDDVRKAVDGNSPGGKRVVIGEAQIIAADALTAILSSLRALPPAWIPHWVGGQEEIPAK